MMGGGDNFCLNFGIRQIIVKHEIRLGPNDYADSLQRCNLRSVRSPTGDSSWIIIKPGFAF